MRGQLPAFAGAAHAPDPLIVATQEHVANSKQNKSNDRNAQKDLHDSPPSIPPFQAGVENEKGLFAGLQLAIEPA